jgi:hypothetical protein
MSISKANMRRIDAYHEAGHAVMAWIEGVEITEVRLVPDHECGDKAATTTMLVPAPNEWTLDRLASQVCVTFAGPEGEKYGPVGNLQFAKWEREQHLYQAIGLVKQFGSAYLPDADRAAPFLASLEGHVQRVFEIRSVVHCVELLAREILRRESIPGAEVTRLITERITEEERLVLRNRKSNPLPNERRVNGTETRTA